MHAGGQGVWVARMAGELGAEPVLCGFVGGETGALLRPLLEALPGELRLVETAGASGCYVVDRRDGERELLAGAWSDAALAPRARRPLLGHRAPRRWASDVLAVCNPFPGDLLPLELYANLVADVRANGRAGARRPLDAAARQRARRAGPTS